MSTFSPEILKAMREWIADCTWRDLEDVADLSDAEVIKGVQRHYDGGLPEFLKTCEVAA